MGPVPKDVGEACHFDPRSLGGGWRIDWLTWCWNPRWLHLWAPKLVLFVAVTTWDIQRTHWVFSFDGKWTTNVNLKKSYLQGVRLDDQTTNIYQCEIWISDWHVGFVSHTLGPCTQFWLTTNICTSNGFKPVRYKATVDSTFVDCFWGCPSLQNRWMAFAICTRGFELSNAYPPINDYFGDNQLQFLYTHLVTLKVCCI